ncbi:hypothetical protein [Planctobacterium marinum]|uniref:hypothetical protein n=1 Tax=Planctobacterium marinum TaxID=1631968 RepID=UPI001E3821AE|nr:hypothetical protein [Planctobacterium marinum]MCC2606353.1 hypothetical protein [Planctobacterium marinum]
MSELNRAKEALFTKWSEAELTADEQQQFERWCLEDPAFSDRVAVHGRLQFMAQQFNDEEVPEWSRDACFEQSKGESWWHWKGLPVASMAMSLVAILLVTFKMEVTVHQGSMTISFSGAVEQQKIEQLVNERIAEYAALQNSKFDEQADHLQQQQMQMNTQLANYLLATSRTERREDFAELIKHVNEQRADDQVFYARQINRLKSDFKSDSKNPDWLSEPYEQTHSDN